MAIVSAAVTVGTTATLLTSDPSQTGTDVQSYVVTNNSAVVVSLGGSGVTTANGLPLAANATLILPAIPNVQDELYGVVATGTADVRVLGTRQ